MTVGELLARISSRELTEWALYAEMEPFGETRADLRAGIVASTMANLYQKKGSKALAPADFMPKFGPKEAKEPKEPKEPRSGADLLQMVEMWNAALGGKDLRK